MNPVPGYRLFLDLDGVLVDFDAGVRNATGREPAQMPDRVMWPILARTKDFYTNLPWMPDGRELWEACRPWNPIILTGLPMGKWAEPQKREWCRRELGKDVEVITCMSRQKAEKAWEVTPEGLVPVLVDDRLKLKEPWEAVGGLFILHTSTKESLEALAHLNKTP